MLKHCYCRKHSLGWSASTCARDTTVSRSAYYNHMKKILHPTCFVNNFFTIFACEYWYCTVLYMNVTKSSGSNRAGEVPWLPLTVLSQSISMTMCGTLREKSLMSLFNWGFMSNRPVNTGKVIIWVEKVKYATLLLMKYQLMKSSDVSPNDLSRM